MRQGKYVLYENKILRELSTQSDYYLEYDEKIKHSKNFVSFQDNTILYTRLKIPRTSFFDVVTRLEKKHLIERIFDLYGNWSAIGLTELAWKNKSSVSHK